MSATLLPLRVTVHEMWDAIAMEVATDTTVRALKHRALVEARVTDPIDEFLVKFRGAELADESRTIGDVGIPADAALIVLRRRRRPMR